MRARVEAGTDVALLGAWDAARDAEPFSKEMFRELAAWLEKDAQDGHLFLIHTGADGGGPVDVIVDEPIPAEELSRLEPIEGLRRLSVPSGLMKVAGAESYRAPKPRDGLAQVPIPPGEYAISAFVPRDEEREPDGEAVLRGKVGADALRRYDRINLGVVMGGFAAPSLALLLLVPGSGWKFGVPVAIAVFLAWFPVTQWLLRRSRWYTGLHATVTEARLRHGPASLVLSLRKLEPGETLAGGSVSFPRA